MKLYWKQRKVYLYGLLAVFPERLSGDELAELEEFAGRKLTNQTKKELLLELIKYLTDYEHGRLTTGVSTKPERFGSQEQKLIIATRKKFDKYGYQPIITPADIWPDAIGDGLLMTTFWELVFTEQLRTGHIEMVNMGYSTSGKPLPFVEFEVKIGTLFQQAIEPPKLKKAPPVMQRAWLRMPDKHVFAELGNGASYPFTKQKTGLKTDLPPYSLMKFLVKHPAATVTLRYANEKLDGCEKVDNLGEIVRQSGLTEDLKELFFEVTTAKKVKLKENVYLSADQIALLAK
jgi:hypothetical protein